MTPALSTTGLVLHELGLANIACIIGVTASLNMKAGTPSRWSALTRFLP